jgi:hypothetical protein
VEAAWGDLTTALGVWSMWLIVVTVLAIVQPESDPDDGLFGLKSVGD